MAKKSAKSKGYRRQTAKKPYLSKRDVIILCLILIAITIGAILLFRYDDGALKVSDGQVVAEGDNWLIVDGSNARGRARYFKLGEIGEIEGYSRETSALLTDGNIPQYVFTPEAEDAGIVTAAVSTSHSPAAALAEYTSGTLSNLSGYEMGALQSAEINGLRCEYFIYTVAPAGDAEAEEAEAASFVRSLSGYIDGLHDSCVVIRVDSAADSLEGCATEEALLSALEQAASAITLDAE